MGENIESAIDNGRDYQRKGYRYSFDMLGRRPSPRSDAPYHLAYADAITELSRHCKSRDVRLNPGISVKLSALYPRYETTQREAVLDNLFPSIRSLCLLAKKAGMGLNIDAEEAERLDLSLDIIEALVADKSLHGWHGLGVVVQAYGYRAPHVLDWLYALAQQHDAPDGAAGQGRLLGPRNQAQPGTGRRCLSGIHTQEQYRCQLPVLCRQTAGPAFAHFPCATHNAHTLAAILATDR
ncbi:MAG: proline dehydrogenase family protein [Thiolinea sp.]